MTLTYANIVNYFISTKYFQLSNKNIPCEPYWPLIVNVIGNNPARAGVIVKNIANNGS